jgi:GH24 family phage-related lysozyme (muramidase)
MARKRSHPASTRRRRQKLSDAGARLIAEFEGFRSELYNDPADHCTIGYGHLVHRGPIDGSESAEFKKGITRKRALELLQKDAGAAAGAVNDGVKVPLSQQQFDALVSFVFNVGSGAFAESTLLRLLNEGRYDAVPEQLDRWVKADGKTLEGLVRRRKAEGAHFATGKGEAGPKKTETEVTKKGGRRKAAVDDDGAAEKIHRDLHLTTPLTEGADVKALQQALNRIAGWFPKTVPFQLVEDGKLGDKTFQAAFKAGHVMGLNRSRLNDIEKEHTIDQRVQRMLRNPEKRSDAQKTQGKERREALRKKLDRRPNLKNLKVTSKARDPHWGGSGDVMANFVEPFLVKRGLPLGSGKRTPTENARIGGSTTSDHLTTHSTTAARDFPTFQGEDDARALAEAMGCKSWRPNSYDGFTFSAGGHTFQAQILWGSDIKHGDHVHVGISPA